MARADLGDLGLIIDCLEQRGRLIRVKSEVDPVHDLAGVAAKLEGRPAAVLFESVKGHEAPVFTGLYWSRALLADLLEQPEKQLPAYVSGCIKEWQQKPMPPVVVEHGPVLEVTENEVDLSKLPIPTHALQDSRSPLSERLDALEKLARELPEGTSGVVVAIGERLVLLEVLAGPRTFARVFRKLLSGYAFESVGLDRPYGTPDPQAVRSFIEAAAKAAHEEHQAVGSGRDVRFEDDGISGYALIGERGVLHATAFAG